MATPASPPAERCVCQSFHEVGTESSDRIRTETHAEYRHYEEASLLLLPR